ncbi:MAG: hypothetical protein QW815_09700 [Nitrososphaerota archaeon]
MEAGLVVTPYQKGRVKEYKVMGILRKEGWLCVRVARSRGPADILAGKKGNVKLIQVKSGKGRISDEELKELRRWSKAFGATAEVWLFKKGSLTRWPVYTPKGR